MVSTSAQSAFQVSGLDGEVEHGGEAHRPQKAQLIFSEALRGISDRAQSAGLEVRAPADKVEHFSFDRIVEEAINGEIPASWRLLPER